MRIAICLFGLIGGKSDKNGKGESVDIAYARKGFSEAFERAYDVDYYIHTWSDSYHEELMAAYTPEKIVSEPVLDFDSEAWKMFVRDKIGMRLYLKTITSGRDFLNVEAVAAYRAYSRWLSTKRAFNLVPDELVSGYDFIVSARLDLEFFNPIMFPNNLKENELLVSHWNDARIFGQREKVNQINHSEEKHGFMDLWFAGRPRAMRKFCLLHDLYYEYESSPHKSSYQHCYKSGLIPRYFLYRGYDYEIVRRHRYDSTK